MHVVTISRAHLRAAIVVVVGAVFVGALLGRVADARYEDARPPRAVPKGPPTDAFERPDGAGLGTTDDGRVWDEHGRFAIVRGAAAVDPAQHGWATALVDVGAADGEVSAVVRDAARPMGLVVRARDAANYLSVEPALGRGVWEVVRVTNGERARLKRTSLAGTAAGVVVLVGLEGPTVSIRIDGRLVGRVDVPELADATLAGIAMHPSAVGARWDNFYAAGRS